MAVLGIDTSCYTTSVAVTGEGSVIADLRQLLEVEKGGLGLRQSEALFRHVRNLPRLIGAAFERAREEGAEITAVSASHWPRRAEGSYMPAFTAGSGYASAIASALAVPLVKVSHQEGHIAACGPDAGLSPGDSFLAVHLSGGTTEVLAVGWEEAGMRIRLMAASSDLSAGQMIDRIGVGLGLGFPAGPALERLAADGDSRSFRIPSHFQAGSLSFSGPCEAALRGIRDGVAPGEVARAAFDCVSKGISKAVEYASSESGLKTVLVAGGVAANCRIRDNMREHLGRLGLEVLFGSPALSSDNAVGVSYLGELWA